MDPWRVMVQVLPSVWVHQDDPRAKLRGEAAWKSCVSKTWPYPYVKERAMDRPTCSSCVYWKPEMEEYGQCRRHAPRSSKAFTPVGRAELTKHAVKATMTMDSYWCGEHDQFIKWMLDLREFKLLPSKEAVCAPSASSEGPGTTGSKP